MGHLKKKNRVPRKGGVKRFSVRKRAQWVRQVKGLTAKLEPRTAEIKQGRNEINPETGRKYKYD